MAKIVNCAFCGKELKSGFFGNAVETGYRGEFSCSECMRGHPSCWDCAHCGFIPATESFYCGLQDNCPEVYRSTLPCTRFEQN